MAQTAAFAMSGEIDGETTAEVEAEIRKWLAAGGQPIIDMTGVTFIGSTGLNMLVRVRRDHGQPLTLQGVKPTTARLLQLTALDRLFTITS